MLHVGAIVPFVGAIFMDVGTISSFVGAVWYSVGAILPIVRENRPFVD